MPANLTFPGDVPGLLRRGSPVFYRDEESWWTVLCIEGDEACAAPVGMVPLGAWGHLSDFALDLSDPTGQAHLAWWVGNQSADRITDACRALGIDRGRFSDTLVNLCQPIDGREAADVEQARRVALVLAVLTPTRPEPCPHTVAVLWLAAHHYEPADAGEES